MNKKRLTIILSSIVLLGLFIFGLYESKNKNINEDKNETILENSESEDELKEYEINNEVKEKLVLREKRSDNLEEAIEYATKDLKELFTSKEATYDRLYTDHEFTEEIAKKAIDTINWDYKENAFKRAEHLQKTNNESLTNLYEVLIGIFKFNEEESSYAIKKLQDTDPMENGVSRDFNAAKKYLETISVDQHNSKKAFENILIDNLLFPKEASDYALENVKIDYNENALHVFKDIKEEDKDKSDEEIREQLEKEYLFTKEESEFAYKKYTEENK